jgi:hypothetical protein
MALNIFYERIVGVADDFAEAYQGRHGLIGPITLHSAKKTSNIQEFLEDSLKQIDAVSILLCKILGIGFFRFPTNFDGLWIAYFTILSFNLMISIISTFYVLKLKCLYPKLK